MEGGRRVCGLHHFRLVVRLESADFVGRDAERGDDPPGHLDVDAGGQLRLRWLACSWGWRQGERPSEVATVHARELGYTRQVRRGVLILPLFEQGSDWLDGISLHTWLCRSRS